MEGGKRNGSSEGLGVWGGKSNLRIFIVLVRHAPPLFFLF